LYDVISSLGLDAPTKTIRIGVAVVQRYRSPHGVVARGLEELALVKRGIPFREVEHVGVERSIGSRVQSWRNPFLIFQFAFNQAIPAAAMRNDIGLADDARGAHS